MVLDHGGPDLAYILYGSALKLWVIGALLVGLAIPIRTGAVGADAAIFFLGMFALAIVCGIIESTMARLRLLRMPQLLIAGSALAFFALLLVVRS
jgi:formate hydrogenlyase subunit 4